MWYPYGTIQPCMFALQYTVHDEILSILSNATRHAYCLTENKGFHQGNQNHMDECKN